MALTSIGEALSQPGMHCALAVDVNYASDALVSSSKQGFYYHLPSGTALADGDNSICFMRKEEAGSLLGNRSCHLANVKV